MDHSDITHLLAFLFFLTIGIIQWRRSYKKFYPSPEWKSFNSYTVLGDIAFFFALIYLTHLI